MSANQEEIILKKRIYKNQEKNYLKNNEINTVLIYGVGFLLVNKNKGLTNDCVKSILAYK